MKTNRSIVDEIRKKITALFSIFLIMLVAMVGFSLVKQKSTLEQEDIKRTSESLVSDFKAHINEVIYQVAPLSEDHILSSLPSDLLFTQYAVKALTNLVDNTAMVKSAFINDGSVFTVEGYPFYTLKWNSSVFSTHANKILSQQRRTLKIDKLIVPVATIEGQPSDRAKLFLAIPLRQKLSSLMRPYKYTGVLYLEIDFSPFLETHHRKGAIWFSSDGLILETPNMPRSENGSYKSIVYSPKDDLIPLNLKLQREAQVFSYEIVKAVLYIVLIGLVLVILLTWYLRRLAKRLTTPMLALERHCERLKKGHYVSAKNEFEFRELRTLQVTLNQLAKQIKEQISSLENEKVKAQSSERAKSHFLANMSHELRTPLNGIYGVFQLMKHHRNAADSKELIMQGMTSTETLLSLLNDLLDFSKIEAGELKMEATTVDIRRIVADVKQEFTHTAGAKQIALIVNTDDLASPYRRGDSLRLKQVLRNLISNAVKFTSDGSVTVVIQDAGNQLSINVIDTGPGISEAALKKLFSRFQQADSSTTRKFGGTGLGLAIVKQLAELMNGKVTVSSKEGIGSEFKVVIELPVCEAPEQPDIQDLHAIPQLHGKTLLLAEDNPLNQKIFSAMIKPTEATLVIAKDGVEAMEQYGEIKPDIFFVDIQMPRKDGLKVCAEVRELDTQTPLIAVTANVMSGDLENYQRLGFNNCVAKPIDMKKLYEVINVICQ
ncbi:ATP-binding protein [Pseudoalteromonas piscicida]|uniref:histidine kinase n=1 Tax=Pseudoalteromonas piscicida TaxID=43662 RepID=A0A2A5JSP5_PSEO7|nr:ATP-binding protein [Pseudoalteromonas piscicida]PCK32407.1 hybrid sensor histidine kinase/response regulator [Pseudoalteromonas piscicida]